MVKELPSILCPESLKHYSIGGGNTFAAGVRGLKASNLTEVAHLHIAYGRGLRRVVAVNAFECLHLPGHHPCTTEKFPKMALCKRQQCFLGQIGIATMLWLSLLNSPQCSLFDDVVEAQTMLRL